MIFFNYGITVFIISNTIVSVYVDFAVIYENRSRYLTLRPFGVCSIVP